MHRRAAILVSLLVLGAFVGLATTTGDSDAPERKVAAPSPAVAEVHRASATKTARLAARSDARVIARVLRHVTVIRRGTPHRREVALTFDDGPSRYTRHFVRRLRLLHVPATFFTIGIQLDRYPRAIASELRSGFPVADHTVNHPPLARLPGAAQRREIRGQARRLRRLGVPWPRLFRPPYGSYDRTTEGVARSMGMLVVMWSVDSRDFLRPGRKTIVHNVVSAVRPGAIVLMHDGGGDRSQTLAAVPGIVRTLRRRGYRFVTVPQLLRPRGMSLRGGWITGA
jgi:peptidoglycan/xylan/chitin deacetylase (PgdA/CDA1 family)